VTAGAYAPFSHPDPSSASPKIQVIARRKTERRRAAKLNNRKNHAEKPAIMNRGG
jgi:hypothetical protein